MCAQNNKLGRKLFYRMEQGNPLQRKAFQTIQKLNILEDLSAWTPVLCGTIPIGLDVEGSDLDIILQSRDLDALETKLLDLYGNFEHFRIVRKWIRTQEVVKVNFFYEGFEFELFAQDQPVYEQNAYVHMVIEWELMKMNPSLHENVIQLKRKGKSTEAAFCEVLGISGDPYEGLIRYGREHGVCGDV